MEKIATYNIIGDIHGMPVWKSLVKDECINVFVGDYFDPYLPSISYEDCKNNFLEIIDYKKKHPQTVLLYADHEQHYIKYDEIPEHYSRYDFRHAQEICQLLRECEGYFNGVAYSIRNQYLVTHAGTSDLWYQRWVDRYDGQSPNEVASKINEVWYSRYRAFSVYKNMEGGFAEDGPSHSPLWIRPKALELYNIFCGTPYKQVFGHTPCDSIEETNGLICVDCLRRVKQYEPGVASLIIT